MYYFLDTRFIDTLSRRGAGGMLPIHMACLSGYSDCVENLILPGQSMCHWLHEAALLSHRSSDNV